MAQDDGLELTVESVPGDDRSDTVAGHAERERPTGSLLVVLLLLAAVVAVLLTDTVLSPGSGDDAASVTSADPGDSPLATFDAGLDTEPKEDLVEDAQPFPAVRLTPAANELPGRLALVPVLADDRREDVAVWVVTEGRSTTLYDTPIAAPGLAAVLDRTQPFLSTTDGVLAADERRNLVATSTNGSFTEVAADVVSLIDGDAPDELWILGEDTDLVRRLLPTGAGNRTIELLSVGTGFRTELAVTDGLIGRDDDDRPARWTPATGVTPLTSAGDGIVSVVGAAGDLVALAERDLGRVAVIDVGTDTRIAEVPLGDALLTTCFSPDGRFLAARHYQSGAVAASADDTAPALSEHVTVTELGGTPPVRRRFTIAEPVGDMTWLSPTLLAVATPTSVEVIDVDERTRTPIAQLAGASWWLLDADTPGC